jgi:hypothetical protein
LLVDTSKDGEAVLEQFREMILKTVGANTLTFRENTGASIVAGEITFKVQLNKL